MRLQNKTSLITGGTSGIGKATAILFAQEGARVAITGRDQARGQAVVDEIQQLGGAAIFIPADVRLPADCERAVQETLRAFERLDILFNNAGVYFPGTVLDCSPEEWDVTIDTSLKGTYLMSRASLPSMLAQKSGSIINNSSGWGLVGGDKAAAYCAAKGGIVLLTKAMAIDHSGDGIRINCVCPGDTDTPMLPQEAQLRNMAWSDYLAGASNRPMRRIGTPEEVAKAVLFFASDDASFITGAILAVDGGGTAG